MEFDFIDKDNAEQLAAWNMIENTRSSFFLAGRAGTGKTTFLKNVKEKSSKRFIVLAPTGIAAMNVGGQTIHSFFGLNFGVLTPGVFGSINENKIAVVRHIDGIIIDEVSMVRCDIIDAIDRTLRLYRKSYEPFGGLQMVFVGDMFQLEPIATAQDRTILNEFYPSGCYYFYKSHAIESMQIPKIEFRKIYRQNDPKFIELLEHIRTGNMTHADLVRINSRVVSEGERNSRSVTLTARRDDARAINESRLNTLEGELHMFDVTLEGDCKRVGEIAEEHLMLKEGAQVMFTKNDKDGKWVNGTVGTVKGFSDVHVRVALEDGTEYRVERETWEFTDYEYDKETKTCKQTVIGKATQFPLRLAWAITIHKSQSLTFTHVAVDFGRGAFSNGQAYVALSRARSLSGLELVRPMYRNSVLVSGDVLSFAREYNDSGIINRELSIGSAISEFQRRQDFDGTAVRLFEMAREAAGRGDSALSREIMERCMRNVVDDSCLKGQQWNPVTAVSQDTHILNATGLFYAGEKEKAESILMRIGGEKLRDVNALYILARCLEEKKDWKSVERIYDILIGIHNEEMDRGLQSPSFRKVIYKVACLNEAVYKTPGVQLLKELMAENITYVPYNLKLREIILGKAGVLDLDDPEDGGNSECERDKTVLCRLFMNRNVSDDEFIARLLECKASDREQILEYKRFVRELETQEI